METVDRAQVNVVPSTDAVADSSVIAAYQRQVELVTKAWGRCNTYGALLAGTGLVLLFALDAIFIVRATKHAIWGMPLLLYIVFMFTAQQMLGLRMKELEQIRAMVASDAELEFTAMSRAAWSLQAVAATYIAIVAYVTLWVCGMSL